MFDKDSKVPKFFVYMLAILAVIMLVCIFFNVTAVACIYFIALLLCVVIWIMSKQMANAFTNYKQSYVLFEIINLVATIAVIYYEFTKHSIVLNVFLILLASLEVALVCIDVFFVKNKNISNHENFFIQAVKIGSMICIFTYFYNVSKLWFAIDAVMFETINMVLKIYFNSAKLEKDKNKKLSEKEKQENDVESKIHSAGENEGEIE